MRAHPPLLDLCLSPASIGRAAADHELEPEAFRQAAERLRQGTYQPGRSHRMVLRENDGGTRELHIPPIQDRALQRLILARLGPALDRLFETSSFAWRKGLNREAAARRIERLVHDGWRLGVKADFDRFFDRVPRRVVRDRLEAWLGDDRAAAAIWTFVDEGATTETGLPTGAPLSPLLGNLLLDQFDETIERDGGRLVRYADDFLILTRTREAAERLHVRAQELAADLLLQLNADSAVIDLHEPFDFLGFRFRREEHWRYDGPSGPVRVEELGWKDADRSPSPLTLPFPKRRPRRRRRGWSWPGPGSRNWTSSANRSGFAGPTGPTTRTSPLSTHRTVNHHRAGELDPRCAGKAAAGRGGGPARLRRRLAAGRPAGRDAR